MTQDRVGEGGRDRPEQYDMGVAEPTDQAMSSAPLRVRRLLAGDGIGGRIKARPEDFLVDEQPLYSPSGEGEHLYLGIEKHNLSHGEMVSLLARHYGVDEEAVGFGGMKDKVAVTRQAVSVHLPKGTTLPPPEHPSIRVLWTSRHTNKLRRGHLAGNRFSIRIRDVDPSRAIEVHRGLTQLAASGVPDFFGPQRFGYRANNHVVGALLLTERWKDLLDELLGSRGSPFPARQRERRELYDRGDYAGAAALWSRNDRAESSALRSLRQGKSAKSAVLAVGKHGLNFWVSAVQSAIFNRVLDRRIADGLLTAIVEGDLAWHHRSGKVFPVTPAEMEREDLHARARDFDISPSGPLWGQEMTRATGIIDAIEREALQASGLAPEIFERPRRGLQGGRRPLRVQMINIEVDAGADVHGSFIRVAFDLPRGAYATVALREIMGLPPEEIDGEGR